MAQILVRGLSADTIARLKARARRHGRSLQGEVRMILETSVALDTQEAREVSARWQERLAGGTYSDSAEWIREDRGR